MRVIKMEKTSVATIQFTRADLKMIAGMCEDALGNNFTEEKEAEFAILGEMWRIISRLGEYEYD